VSEKVAMLATLIYIYLPKEMFYVNVLGSEHLYNTLLLAFFSCYVLSWPNKNKDAERRDWLWLIPAGLLLGVMSLVKPLSPVFGVILFCGEIGRWIAPSFFGTKEARGGWLKGIWRTSIVAVLSILVIAPWSIRNYFVFDTFVPLTNNGGYVLY